MYNRTIYDQQDLRLMKAIILNMKANLHVILLKRQNAKNKPDIKKKILCRTFSTVAQDFYTAEATVK